MLHICLYSPSRSHRVPPTISCSSTTPQLSQNTHFWHLSESLHAMIMTYHQVQHTLSMVSIFSCLSSCLSHNYKLTAECRSDCGCGSLLWLAATGRFSIRASIKKSTCHFATVLSEPTHEWCTGTQRASHQSPFEHPLQRTTPISLDHSLQVNLRTCSITASEWIFKFTALWAPSAFPNTIGHGVQVNLCSLWIAAS